MLNTVYAALISTTGGVVLVEPTPLDAAICEERKIEIIQSNEAVCIELEGILALHENGYVIARFEPSIEGEL